MKFYSSTWYAATRHGVPVYVVFTGLEAIWVASQSLPPTLTKSLAAASIFQKRSDPHCRFSTPLGDPSSLLGPHPLKQILSRAEEIRICFKQALSGVSVPISTQYSVERSNRSSGKGVRQSPLLTPHREFGLRTCKPIPPATIPQSLGAHECCSLDASVRQWQMTGGGLKPTT